MACAPAQHEAAPRRNQINSVHQPQEAPVSKAGDQVRALMFKQVAGGYVFRAPNPKVFGRSDHYLVDEAQRDQIVATMTPRRPVLLLAVWIAGFFLAVGAAVVALLVVVP